MADAPKTMHDIAKMLVQPAKPDADQQGAQEDTLDEGNTDEVEEAEGHTDPDIVDGEEAVDEETSEDDEGVDDESETESEDDAGQPDYLEINDDDLIEVKIDGKIEYRSIAEAKKALSGEGAYDKRVKEATELRKQAQAEHTAMLEQFKEANDNFLSVVNALEQDLFTPQTKKPDAKLRQSNPDLYYRQMADYQAEQETLNEGKQKLLDVVNKRKKAVQQQQEAYKQQQAAMLQQKLPALTDPDTGRQLAESMVEVAKQYGFTEQEIGEAFDHRYYLMVADLAKYAGARGAAARKAKTVKNLDGQRAKKPRTLRSGATALKAKARKASAQQKQVMDQARKSGKVKDVAKTLIKSRG